MYPRHSASISEEKAWKYLLQFCWKNHRRFCPRCEKRNPYRLADGRLRCKDCGYTFHDFSGRWINRGNLSGSQWLQLIELFEKEHSIREIATHLKISYNTAYKAVTTIRMAIIAHSAHPHHWIDQSNNLKPIFEQSCLLFGITQSDGRINIDPVADFGCEEIAARNIRMVRRGNIIYTDPFEEFNSLVFFCTCDLKETYRFSRAGIINGVTCFWRFLKKRINKKITWSKFPLLLKEMEFRYNHRNEEWGPIIAGYLCDFEIDTRDCRTPEPERRQEESECGGALYGWA